MSQFCWQVAHCLASQFTLRGLAKLCHIFPVSLQLEGTKQIVPHVSPTANSAKSLTPERGERGLGRLLAPEQGEHGLGQLLTPDWGDCGVTSCTQCMCTCRHVFGLYGEESVEPILYPPTKQNNVLMAVHHASAGNTIDKTIAHGHDNQFLLCSNITTKRIGGVPLLI